MAKIDQPEHRLSHWSCELLDRILIGDCWHTAVDTGTQTNTKTDAARFAWENHRKFMGIKPHHLDLYVYQRETGIYGQYELKWGSNAPSAGQATTMQLLDARHIPNGWGRTVRGFYDWLVAAKFRLHLNAENIVREIEARHEAAQDTADLKKAAPPKKRAAAKPITPKPTGAQLRRFAGVRARFAATGGRI